MKKKIKVKFYVNLNSINVHEQVELESFVNEFEFEPHKYKLIDECNRVLTQLDLLEKKNQTLDWTVHLRS